MVEELLFLVVNIYIVWRLLIALLLMLVVEFMCKLVISGTATLIINSAGFGGYSCSHNSPVPNTLVVELTCLMVTCM